MAYQFLIPGDLESHIIAQFLNERAAEPLTAILESLELQNIALIKTKLKGRYDTDAIFSAVGAERHYLIIKILVKLVLYDFIRRNASRKVPDDFVKDWEWANKLLESIKAGTEIPDGLPAFVNADGSTGRIISGNNKNEDFYI